jgi:hypothetical protein
MRKFFLYSLVAIVILAIALVALLFSPPLHKAVFLWVVRGQLDQVEVDSVRFSTTSFELSQLDISHQGLKFSTDHALLRASWLDVARSKKLRLDEMVVYGLEADLVTLASASGGGLGAWLDLFNIEESEEDWPGVLALMKPSDLVAINRARIDGKVLLPDQQMADMNLAIDDLELGKTARIKLQGAFLDEGGLTPVDRATYDLELELEQTLAGRMDRVTGKVTLQMVGEELNRQGRIGMNGICNLSRTATGEVISILLREEDNPVPLLVTELTTDVDTGQLKGRLETRLNGSLLPVSLLEWPPFISEASLTTKGDVDWNYQTATGSVSVQGSGVLEQRPWQYQLYGSGTTDQAPSLKGFLKTGFADDAGPGDLTIRLDLNTEGDGRVVVPMEVRRGNRLSELALHTDMDSVRLNPFSIDLLGETVYLADLQSVGKALAAWGYSMQKVDTIEGSVSGTGETGPPIRSVPWEGLSGQAKLFIDRLVMPQGYTLDQVNAIADIAADSVSLSSFTTNVAEGSIQAKGLLLHDPALQKPFTFRAEGEVQDLPSGLADLGNGAPITGSWDGTVSVVGQSAQLEALAESVQLSLDLEGTSGILQLSRVKEGGDETMKWVGLGAMLLGRANERLGAMSNMINYLQRVPYDSIRIQVDRYATGQVAIHDFTIQGPELLLTGQGSVNAQSWVTLVQGALDMKLVLGSKGNFGANAAVLGLTGQEQSGDYLLWRQPVQISGTLGNPNYSELTRLILNALR